MFYCIDIYNTKSNKLLGNWHKSFTILNANAQKLCNKNLEPYGTYLIQPLPSLLHKILMKTQVNLDKLSHTYAGHSSKRARSVQLSWLRLNSPRQ